MPGIIALRLLVREGRSNTFYTSRSVAQSEKGQILVARIETMNASQVASPLTLIGFPDLGWAGVPSRMGPSFACTERLIWREGWSLWKPQVKLSQPTLTPRASAGRRHGMSTGS